MKIISRFFKSIFVIICLTIALLYIFDYEYILKGIRVVYLTGHKTAYIDDTPHFKTHSVKNGIPQYWELHNSYNKIPLTPNLTEIHQKYGTVAFLVIKNDQILHEAYYDDYSAESLTNSFSMTKSITSALLFKAIQDGFIPNLNTLVTDYLPQLKGEFARQLTVGDLSSMSSGLNWNENYISPFSMTARAYYDNSIRDLFLNLKVTKAPGNSFKYLSGATQLLALVIEKATHQRLSGYLSTSFWKPMGMRYNAQWQIDGEESRLEKAFCCIVSNARDLARFGKLWLHNGNWNGQQLIPEYLAKKAQQARFPESPQYGYGLWLSNYKGKKISYMRGILGQYVICIPDDDVIIVRLGHRRATPDINNNPGEDFETYIDAVYNMLNQKNI